MNNNVMLGMLQNEDITERDAVHVAVIPVEAGEPLPPGCKVAIREGKAFLGREREEVGVVDPFLRETVLPGERFYLLMPPYSVRGLHHDWTHGAFPRTQPTAGASPSEKWLRAFAEEHRVGFEEMVDGVAKWRYVSFGTDAGPEEARKAVFWEHMSKYTGRAFSAQDMADADFGCSC